MAIAQTGRSSPALTYEDYVAEGEVAGQYDIVNGRRLFMPGPTLGHQRISKNLCSLLLRFEQESRACQMFYAPLDVLIRRFPLQTRQPDLLVIANERLAGSAAADDTRFLTVAPDLVVEILSNSDRKALINDKIADYAAVGVTECWIVRPDEQTVEVLARGLAGFEPVASYELGQDVQSIVFPELRIGVADVFAR
jgi:Uma2 family endonuclease